MPFLEIPIEGSGSVYLETEAAPGARPVSTFGERAQQAVASLDASLGSIQQLATRLADRLREAGGPDQIAVEFGVKASAELRALVVAKGEGEANFTIKLTWERAPRAGSARGTGPSGGAPADRAGSDMGPRTAP